jgi:hypothetical protein
LPEFGDWNLASIDTLAVKEWRADLLADGLSPKRAGKALQVLSQILGSAVEGGRLARNRHGRQAAKGPAQGDAFPRRGTGRVARGGGRAPIPAAHPVCCLYGLASLRVGCAPGRSAGSASLHGSGGRGCGGGQSPGVGSGEDPRGARRADATVGCRGGRRLARRPTSQTGGADVHRPHGGPLSRADFVRNCFKPAVLAANEAIAKLPKDRRPAPLPDGLRFYDHRHTCASLLIAQARASRRCRRSWGMRPPASPSTPMGTCSRPEMEALADRLEMVRDAALAKRARTQHGPKVDRLGGTAGE